MRRAWKICVWVAACLVLLPGRAGAQAISTGVIAGAVRDSSGAVMPGVTVEASSPALIEKLRTVVTDDQGNYKIVDLRPGTFTVTFTLSGFATFKREGVQLSAGFTAAVNAEMKVGDLSETITVTGASPTVDVQNVRTQNVLSRDVLDAVPTYKTINGFAALTLGAVATFADVGGNRGEVSTGIAVHGGRLNDAKLYIDGMPYNSSYYEGGGQMAVFQLNQVGIQETVLGISGASAESETGGVQINHVPKDGGNTFRLYFNGNYSNGSMQATNLTDEIRARGLTTAAPLKQVWDWGVGLGGRIVRDRLWFYTANRWWGAQNYNAGAYYNASPNHLFYVPDLARQGFDNQWDRDNGFRFTWQATSKQKFTLSDNLQRQCRCRAGNAVTAPEAASVEDHGPSHLFQTTWSYPATNRLLVAAGSSFSLYALDIPRPYGVTPNDISVLEQSTGLRYGSATSIFTPYGEGNKNNIYNTRASVSYVTGSHGLKVGLQNTYAYYFQTGDINQSMSYSFRNALPVSLTQYAGPFDGESNYRVLALFAQDQWTIARWTLNLGLRFDRFLGWNPEQTRPAGRFVQALPSPRVDDVPNYKDLTPRLGVSYDMFGNGKTAVKASVGRYLSSLGVGLPNATLPAFAIGTSATRTWNDANGDYTPNCDLNNFAANSECGALTSSTFGRPIITTRYDPSAITGWGTRGSNTQVSVSLQHELRARMSVSVAYYQTRFDNFTALNNTALSPSDFTSYCVTAPSDPRLPDGGGYQLCGLYDVNPNRFGQVSNVIEPASEFGDHTERFDAVDMSFNSRFAGRGEITGGISLGRRSWNYCYQNDRPMILAGSFGSAKVEQAGVAPSTEPRNSQFCDVSTPWTATSQGKVNAIYPLPWDSQVSFVYQNMPPAQNLAVLTFTNDQVAPSLGRNLAACPAAGACTATVNVSLLRQQSKFEKRLQQFDVRLSKTLRLGSARVQGMFDIYNLFNAATILGANAAYGPAWLRPTDVLGARLFKLGAQVDF